MREIKFRAFHKKEKRFNYFKLGNLDGEFIIGGEGPSGYLNLGDDEFAPKADFSQPEEFTGLKDKKGRDIYTGDFVRQHGTLYEIRPCIGGFECQIWKEYKNGGAEEGSVFIFSCLLDTACEVVGNIHENWDLVRP